MITKIVNSYGQDEITLPVANPNIVVNVGFQGLQGVKGDDGDSSQTIYFDFGDATPLPILTLTQDSLITSITLLIINVFNGAGATVSVGIASDNDLLMATNDNDLSQIGAFETFPNEVLTIGEVVKVFINSGSGATTGRCAILIKYALA